MSAPWLSSHGYVHALIHKHTHTHTHTHNTRTHSHTHTRTHTHTHTPKQHTHIHLYTHTVCTHIHTYTHTQCAHTNHIHTCTQCTLYAVLFLFQYKHMFTVPHFLIPPLLLSLVHTHTHTPPPHPHPHHPSLPPSLLHQVVQMFANLHELYQNIVDLMRNHLGVFSLKSQHDIERIRSHIV